jgi:uncharacterized membrane protein YfcA
VAALAALPFGLAIGLSLGLLGGGGSVLAVPVLVYVLGEDVHSATTASLVVVTAGALAGGLRHARERRVCWRHAALFTAGALPGAVVGTALGNEVGGRLLLVAFALLMVVSAVATWLRAGGRSPGARGGPERSGCPAARVVRDVSAGAVVGLVTGFFGVGGGIVIVPALVLLLAFSMRPAIGTSLAIITASSVMGVAVHLLAGRSVDPAVTAAMAAACVAGALAGARLAGQVPQRLLGRAFALLVAGVAVSLLVSAAVAGVPSGG